MNDERTRRLVEALVIGADALASLAHTANRGKAGLDGRGRYAERFHDEVVKLIRVQNTVSPLLKSIDAFNPTTLLQHLATVTNTRATLTQRDTARRQIRLICETEVLPNITNLSSPTQPTSEPVLSAGVLANAHTYLQRTLLQANGNYEKRWFDASSVMIRKLVENLIIDVYEHHKKQAEVQKDGEYFMLSGLITALLNQTHWTLQRETKQSLPNIKRLGDRAAHNRRYEAQRQDIDQILQGLRATVDDLLHLSGQK